MALSRVGGSSAAANSIAIPAHQAGDLIIIWAYRDGSTTPPTVPTAGGTVPTFTTIDGPTGANNCSAVCAYAVAAGTTDTSGTWTNATGISVEVWRGQADPPIGDHAQTGASNASGSNISIPSITLTDASGNSAILAFAGWQTVTAWNAAPSGYTTRSSVATEVEVLTKDSTTADGGFNVVGTASGTGGTRKQQIEIIAFGGNRVTQQVVEALLQGPTQSRITQQAIEVLGSIATAGNRITQQAVEVLLKLPVSVGFISSVTVVYAPTMQGYVDVPFVGSVTVVYDLQLNLIVPFIGSNTAVYAPDLQGYVAVPFVASSTAVYAPTLASASTQVDVPFISSATVVYGPALPTQVPSGSFVYAADAPNVYLLPATESSYIYRADSPVLFGAIQAPSGTIIYTAGQPRAGGPLKAQAGVFTYRADPPKTSGLVSPTSGRFFYKGDAPTLYPAQATAGVFKFTASNPAQIPFQPVSARFLFRGDSPVVYPVQAPSAKVVYLAGAAELAHANIILHQSGIIRYRADVPVVTPLTEPPPPPPPTLGTGVKIAVTL